MDPNTCKNGPSSARQRNANGVQLAVDDGPTMNVGLIAL